MFRAKGLLFRPPTYLLTAKRVVVCTTEPTINIHFTISAFLRDGSC